MSSVKFFLFSFFLHFLCCAPKIKFNSFLFLSVYVHKLIRAHRLCTSFSLYISHAKRNCSLLFIWALQFSETFQIIDLSDRNCLNHLLVLIRVREYGRTYISFFWDKNWSPCKFSSTLPLFSPLVLQSFKFSCFVQREL